MTWLDFSTYLLFTAVFWVLGMALLLTPKKSIYGVLRAVFFFLGWAALITFTIGLWISLERPPFRTMGETRLWYSIFLSTIGIVMYYRWRLAIIPVGALLMSLGFLYLVYSNPDTFDKTLMPALLSPWFIPHVVVYMIAYAFLGLATLIGLWGLFEHYYGNGKTEPILQMADNMIYIGFAFLTFGLLFGALWAKEAWGHYWTWDPKETWAFLTWLLYLIYIHYRLRKKDSGTYALWIISAAFFVLLIAWAGVNYLPSAQSSVHVY